MVRKLFFKPETPEVEIAEVDTRVQRNRAIDVVVLACEL